MKVFLKAIKTKHTIEEVYEYFGTYEAMMAFVKRFYPGFISVDYVNID